MEEIEANKATTKVEELELEIDKVEEIISVLIDRGIDNVYVLQLREILHSLMEYKHVVSSWEYKV